MKISYRVHRNQSEGIIIRAMRHASGLVSSIGQIVAYESRVDGEYVLQVENVFVSHLHLRQGVGTRLYELVAKDACRRGIGLASSARYGLNQRSEGFWKKQARLGRVTIRGEGDRTFYFLRDPCAVKKGFFA